MTLTRNADGTPGPSLEDMISRRSLDALKTFTEPTFTLNGGTECTRYMQGEVSVAPPDGIGLVFGEQVVHVARMTFTLSIEYVQWPYTYDRGKDYVFALTLEDCVRNSVFGSKIILDEWFPFEELAGLRPVTWPPAQAEGKESERGG